MTISFDPLHPQRSIVKYLASFYALNGDEEIFDEMWTLYRKYKGEYDKAFYQSEESTARYGLMVTEVVHNLSQLALFIFRGQASHKKGLSIVDNTPLKGRFVVFSDHHMTPRSSRQDFFFQSGNRDLYMEILSSYYLPSNFALIENGDVEELLIFEPTMKKVQGIGDKSWNAIDRDRLQRRLGQLAAIIDDNMDYYRVIAEFIKRQQYFKLIGNHDHNVQERDFWDLFKEKVNGEFPKAIDVLTIGEATSPAFVVCHGHQFDNHATPMYASTAGEAISESISWALQGPDRTWAWEDDVVNWVSGREHMRNNLVSDAIEGVDFTPEILLAIAACYGVPGAGALAGLVAASKLPHEAFWEWVFGQNIAWEYFESDTPAGAAFHEILFASDPDERELMKIRHLNEVRIHQALGGLADGHWPVLILGHSHEPRINAAVPSDEGDHPSFGSRRFDSYLNSGAAGRFENLIWAIEVDEGTPRLVSWHRENGPKGKSANAGEPVRTDWEAVHHGGDVGSFLRASKAERLSEIAPVAPELPRTYEAEAMIANYLLQ